MKKKVKPPSATELPDVPKGLPEHLEDQRTRVTCGRDMPVNVNNVHYSGAYASMGVDNSLDLQQLRKDFYTKIVSLTPEVMEVEVVGIDAAIANALRRILIAEVPTVAIEHVFISNNTSIMQDEVLAHRLGLVPILAPPGEFQMKKEEDTANESNTAVFRLSARCTRSSENGGSEVVGADVLSSQLEWMPEGSRLPEGGDTRLTSFVQNQKTSAPGGHIRPVHPDILLCKLRPGQEIELEAHAVLGLGRTHAKWSPVATAFYRLLPEVILPQSVTGSDAEELHAKCPVKVFDLEDLGGTKYAKVARPRDCTICRECIRDPSWEKRVVLKRKKDHFIFTIESTGQIPPEQLFKQAISILRQKSEKVASLN